MVKNLIKLRLAAFFSGFASKNKKGEYQKPSSGKIALFALLYLFIIAMFGFMSIGMSLSLGIVLIPLGMASSYFGLITVIAFAVVFVLSIFETKSELFDCKDNELILSMPIKPGNIVLARIFVVLIINYIISAVVFLPAIVIYAVISAGEPLGIIGSLLSALLTPLAATALSSVVGYLVAVITKRFKNKTVISLVAYISFMALYFWGYSSLIGGVSEENMDEAITGIAESLGFASVIGEASLLKPIPALVYFAICIVISVAAYIVISKYYFSIIMANYSVNKAVYKKKELKRSSAIVALSKKELARFYTHASYILNCSMGLIFSLVISVFAVVKSNMLREFAALLLEILPNLNQKAALGVAFSVVLIFMSSMTTISACALSLEGNSLWIPKSMPIKSRDVLLSKAVPHIIVSAPISLVSSLLFIIAGRLDILSSVLVIFLPLAANVLIAFIGVILNVVFPKFKYNNEIEPIKQSASVGLIMLVGIILAFVCGGIAVLGVIFSLELFMHTVILIFIVMLCVAAYFIITRACVRRYERF